jgi:hypothetical protein
MAILEMYAELTDRLGNFTITAEAVLRGVTLDPLDTFERDRLADALTTGTLTDAEIEDYHRRNDEADAQTGESVLYSRLEYWAKKDYGGYLRAQQGLVVMVWQHNVSAKANGAAVNAPHTHESE